MSVGRRRSTERPAGSVRGSLHSWVAAGVIAVAALLFQSAISGELLNPKSDFSYHLRWAQNLLETGLPERPYFLYHLATLVLASLPGIGWEAAGFYLIPAACHAAIAFLLVRRLGLWPGLALTVAGPVSFWTWPDLYKGYAALTAHHNPTGILAKTLALALFATCFGRAGEWRWGRHFTLGVAAATVASVMAKPSFLIAFLPGAALAAAIQALGQAGQGRGTPQTFLRGGALSVAVPAVAVLALQFVFRYVVGAGEGGLHSVVFAPLEVMGFHSRDVGLKFVSSIIFPAVATGLFWKEARWRPAFTVAWLTFAISAFYAYFLAEGGVDRYSGNFIWSLQLALFVLFFECASVIRAVERASDWKRGVAWGALALHVLGGAAIVARALETGSVQP